MDREIGAYRNLNSAYIDPEIQLTKVEYISQKELISSGLKGIADAIKTLEEELSKITKPVEAESLEVISSMIGEYLNGDFDPPKEIKREIL